ncbi:uncharacterized protein METZ01_LOCUS356194, partial [marine metagenome]
MRRTYGLALAAIAATTWVTHEHQNSLLAQEGSEVITGSVTSAAGPEAGVWVIAETDDLETVFRKIVVTDDDGRFLLPEIPDATYDVWVRGYGLVDSTPVNAMPGAELELTATVAATPQEAAQVYPSNYWLSLIDLPDAHEFPGTGDDGNGINENLRTQDEWINVLKGCQRCHQVGNERTRVVPDLDQFDSTVAAWDNRTRRGQRGSLMSSFITQFGRGRGLDM